MALMMTQWTSKSINLKKKTVKGKWDLIFAQSGETSDMMRQREGKK